MNNSMTTKISATTEAPELDSYPLSPTINGTHTLMMFRHNGVSKYSHVIWELGIFYFQMKIRISKYQKLLYMWNTNLLINRI